MGIKRAASVRFVDFEILRLTECHKNIIGLTFRRNGLVAALAAAKASLGPDSPEYRDLIELANARQKYLISVGLLDVK